MVPVYPSPVIQPYCKPVSSISLKKLGAYSINPLRLTKKGPLSNIPVKNGDVIEEVQQLDTTVFEVTVTDDNGSSNKYTLVIPEPQ